MSRRGTAAQAPKTDAFDESYNRASGAAAVLKELADAKIESSRDEQFDFWLGMQAIFKGIATDLDVMQSAETEVSNRLFALEHPDSEAPRKAGTGGAR